MHLTFQRTTSRLSSLKTASIAGRIPPDNDEVVMKVRKGLSEAIVF